MKRKYLLLSLLFTTAIAMTLLVIRATVAKSPSAMQRQLELWGDELIRLTKNPLFVEANLDRFIDAALERPGLAKYLEEAHSSGIYDRVLSFLSDDIQQRILYAASAKSFKLTFPHGGNGQGGGLILQTNVILINNSETNAGGTVFLRKTDGSDWTVNTNKGSGKSFSFSLLPGETFRLETDGAGTLTIGWIEVSSDIPLSGSATFVLSSASGEFLSEVGVSDSPRAKSLMIFVDTTEGKNTGYAVANPSLSASAKVKIELRKLDGTAVASKETTLAPLNQRSEFVTETFPGQVGNFKGLLLITTADTEVSVITLRTRDVRFTSLPPAPLVTETNRSTTLYFARVGDGLFGNLKLQSSFILMNNSAKKAAVSVEAFRNNGAQMQLTIGGTRSNKFSVEVPAGGAVELISDGSNSPGLTGWARVTSDTPLGGTGTFSIKTNDSGQFVSEVGVGNSPTTANLSIFVQVSGAIDTGLGVTNLTSSPLTLRLVGATGSKPLAEKTLNLNFQAHDAKFVSDLFSDVPEVRDRNFEGRLEVIGSFFTAITLRTRGTLLTSLPVAALIQTSFTPKLTIAPATSLEGSSPAFYLTIREMVGHALLRKATLKFSAGSLDFSKLGSNPVFGDFTGDVFGFLFKGHLFVAVPVGSTSNTFFTSVTDDGIKEKVPFVGTLSNNAGGGFTLELDFNAVRPSAVSSTVDHIFCFDPGVIRLPAGSSTITVIEEYGSFEQTEDAGDILKRNASSTFVTSVLASGNPRIDSVTPSRVVAGSEVVISGSNFSGNAADNKVTVEGNSRVDAAVLEASATSLRVRIPENARTGTLKLEVAGKSSNDYRTEVPFAPRTSAAFGSLANNAETTVKFTLTQNPGEIALLDFVLKPAKGTWKTAGFSVDALLGEMKLGSNVYELKVKSSDATKLVINGIQKGKSTPDFTLEATHSPGAALSLAPTEARETLRLESELTVEVNFTQAIFKMPSGAGTTFDVEVEVRSLPQRTKITGTSHRVSRKQTFVTS